MAELRVPMHIGNENEHSGDFKARPCRLPAHREPLPPAAAHLGAHCRAPRRAL